MGLSSKKSSRKDSDSIFLNIPLHHTHIGNEKNLNQAGEKKGGIKDIGYCTRPETPAHIAIFQFCSLPPIR